MAERKKKFTSSAEPMDRGQMNSWIDIQKAYPNTAGDDEEVDKRAVQYVEQQINFWSSATGEIMDKWQTFDFMTRGVTLSNATPDADIHVPIIQTKIEQKVPRIVEAITSSDPWFNIEGRDKLDRKRARKIKLWLDYQCDLVKLSERMEEFVRPFEGYQIVIAKTDWHTEYRKQIVKERERKPGKDGKTVTTVKAVDKEVQVYEGNRLHQVSNYRFFCDARKTDPQKMSFIGDVCEMTEDELLMAQKDGLFNNVDKLINPDGHTAQGLSSHGVTSPGGAFSTAETAERDRSMLSNIKSFHQHHAKGEPRIFMVAECWCKWRAHDEDDFEEWILTVCGGVALQVQRNYNDDQHRPYCIGRSSKDGFELFGVGPVDHALRPQMEMDDQHNLTRRTQKMALSPHIFVSPDADMPENIFDAEPGAVFRVSTPPSISRVPSVLGDAVGYHMLMERVISDVMGVPAVFSGNESVDTATQSQNNRIEGNLRMRQEVYRFSDFLAQILNQFYANSKQFVTDRKVFRVLGGAGKAMIYDMELTPEDLVDPVDIRITGLQRLSTYGMRATQMATFQNMFGPMLMTEIQKGNFNTGKYIQEGWYNFMGYRLDEDIIAEDPSADDAMLPSDENILMGMGHDVDVHPLDNHAEHKLSHLQAYAVAEDDDEAKRLYVHLKRHESVVQQQQARKAQQESTAAGPYSTGPAQDERLAPQDGRSSDQASVYSRPPDTLGSGAVGTPPGETPGPARAGAVAAPDRDSALPMTTNRG